MTGALILWANALSALLYGLVAAAQVGRSGGGWPRRAFAAALGVTALWSLASAGLGGRELATRLAESAHALAWLGFMWSLARRGDDGRRDGPGLALGAVYGVVALVATVAAGLGVVQSSLDDATSVAVLVNARLILRMMAAVSALVLVHQLHAATGAARGGLRLVVLALAAAWSLDLTAYAAAWTLGGWPPALEAARGVATLALLPLFAVAGHRDGAWTLQLSRTVAWQSLSAVALALYLGLMLLGAALLGAVGGAHARIWQTGFAIGSATALLTIASTPWLRAWAKVKLAKHLFRHRYDYRAEWVRFTDTLGRPGDAAAPLETRVVKAIADLTDSPAGLLLAPDGPGLGVGAGWRWEEPEVGAGDEPLARHLAATGRILELDAVRAGTADPADIAAVPGWMLARDEAWVVAPLIHLGQLTGAILLARPPVDRALDWEDLDLLRICGRQVASYLAEQRAHEKLADASRFDEFNRRFAFILHDIKNLVSQQQLVARNVERHADNPAFRADMIATLKESAERMTALLARLSPQGPRAQGLEPVDAVALVERVVRAPRGRPVAVEAGERPHALADPARLEQLLSHLVQNAADASAPDRAVTVAVQLLDGQVAIDVVDRGCGMSPGFVRDQLFRPFVSTKPGGFGIGAFEARQLAEGMGGTVRVWSREGEGTRFRVTLPAAQVGEMEQAA